MRIIINNKEFDVDIADTFSKRFFGLMGKTNIRKGLFFPKTNAIHTFFMKEEIDIIMIDKENNIIYYEENVSKNRIIIKRKAHHTIELPNNLINEVNIHEKIIIF